MTDNSTEVFPLKMLDTPTREIFWQVSDRWVFYVLSLATMAAVSWGLYKAIRFVRGGTVSSARSIRMLGVRTTLTDILFHRPLAGEDSSRWWHLLIFYGFVLLLLVTCYLMLAHYGYEALFTGTPYLLVTLVADLAGAGLILGVLVALFTIRKDASPARDRTLGKVSVLSLLGLVCVTGFFVEGLRIHVEGDSWKMWSPVGAVASWLFPSLTELEGHRLFKGLWWLHSVLALGLIAWIPLSARLRHMLFLPFHRATTPMEPRSPAPFIDVEAIRTSNPSPGSVRLGIETPAGYHAEAAVGPSRLHGVRAMRKVVPCLSNRAVPYPKESPPGPPRIRRATRRKREGGTRTISVPCERGDHNGFPVGLQALPGLRRAVSGRDRTRAPDDRDEACRGAWPRKAPGRGGRCVAKPDPNWQPVRCRSLGKGSWIREQRIPDPPAETGGKPLFLWTGCFQPGDEQKPRVLSCLVELLKDLEIPFFIPEDTSCCGDPARILGEEDLFQTLAREQIKKIEASGADQVLVHCPHCYTVLKDVYPLLGARFSVIHTSELFKDRVQEKKLQGRGFPNPLSVVYHDPCFLSRYQELADPPRSVLEGLAGLELREPLRARREGFCCGAGGGHFFMDLDLEERPSSQRLEEMLAQGPDVLAVSCGFCFSMFDDALRRLPDPPALRIADWLELLKEASEK